MGEPRVTAVWFTDGWARAYHVRAACYGPEIPEEAYYFMLRSLNRMHRSQRREDAQRLAEGRVPIWFPFVTEGKV